MNQAQNSLHPVSGGKRFGLLATYLLAGCVVDLMIALYYRMISLSLRPQASGSAIIITLVNFVVFSYVIRKWNWGYVIAYSIGTGIGTWIAMSIGLGV